MEKKKNELRRKSPEKIIESKSPVFEHAYIKAPRKRLIDVTKENDVEWVVPNIKTMREFYRKRGNKPYMFLHEHGGGINMSALPSLVDLKKKLYRKMINTDAIIQRDLSTGEVQGYTFLHHKKNAKPLSNTELTEKFRKLNEKYRMYSTKHISEKNVQGRIKIIEGQGFDIRFHPAEDYYFDKSTGCYKKKPEHNLEGAVASILIGFAFMFLLIKIPISGFAIADSVSVNNQAGLAIIGGLFFSLIAYFILVQIKKMIRA